MGREHISIQTDQYWEYLTDKPPTEEIGIATEFYLDRPPVPIFEPKMPAKENCKATQIYDGDAELFDFNQEVEPMLNVLCLKTLEQARMEVLEENELRIMDVQKKEYEEIRNAELIEAQRFEAAEARIKAEQERRKIQQKARKDEKRFAHQKHCSRVKAKSYLTGLRECAIQGLSDVGLMQQKTEINMYQDVLPWLLDKRDEFLQDQTGAVEISNTIVEEGIVFHKKAHAAFLHAR